MGVLTLAGTERAARARLPPEIWDFIEGGSGAERALAANREIFGRHALRPRRPGRPPRALGSRHRRRGRPHRVIDLLREELEHTMALLGRPRLADLDRTALAPWPCPAGGRSGCGG
ncbi:alpha-hydroxy-acid oxidizing protein [Kitasatospora brasiliensis]|uniref:alpha-hydroxy-acid oxidizing protein n=1 Tax=Kitasatospora brasiliensis TaxID=3058040 RepID=UPI0029306D7B|nr:alpha-hydroxy-acid oxidizing protein [Kitasatospora sp. K002]